MKTYLIAGLLMVYLAANAAEPVSPSAATNAAIPWDQIGTKTGAGYKGDSLAVTPTADGARLRCVFQRLYGEATREGLWLTSTVTDQAQDRFRVTAIQVGRTLQGFTHGMLPDTGDVLVEGQTVRFTRPGLVEEYSVSMDGVRQDFVVLERPAINHQLTTFNSHADELRVALAVTGARVESTAYAAQLVLEKSGRKIAYSRLRVTDAAGKELPARMAAGTAGGFLPAELRTVGTLAVMRSTLAVMVNDADAVYPIRIDPTFSDANWVSMGGLPGADGRVNAAVVDGSGNLYIGGQFTVAGGVVANRIAKWNGSSWSALGSGMDNQVNALVVSGSDLYVGGSFTTATNSGGVAVTVNRIAKWNGSSWSAVGSGVSGQVNALAASGSDVYAGGGNSSSIYVAKWNGSSWSTLSSGMGGSFLRSVYALAVLGSDVYVGGLFATVTNSSGVAVTVNNIAKWNGSSWSALGSGMSDRVNALAVSGSSLYVGGFFTMATNSGGVAVAVHRIARWNGSSWSALGSGIDGLLYALAVSGSDLYAGGLFSAAGDSAASCIAKWNGSSWSALGLGMNHQVNTLVVSGSDLYAGGLFTTAGGSAASYIAKWNGGSWNALGLGINNKVHALAVSGGDLYVGGQFTMAGGVLASNIAKWNGSSWSALGSGMNDQVNALAVSGSDVYAGGYFTTAGGSAASGVAKWNGSSWSAVGSGISGIVEALAVSGSDLYAGGYFKTAGGVLANNIAKWNGSSWSPLGSGVGPGGGDAVYALAVSGSDLYAGGTFTTVSGNIAKWNGSGWSPLGSGIDGQVHALAVLGSDVYAGGGFTTAGSNTVNLAKWNGSNWSALGLGVYGGVEALAVSGSDLYVGGPFLRATNSGGVAVTVNNIAKWNGSSWSALGSGMGGTSFPSVNALAVSGNYLYAGGSFTMAGGKVSPYAVQVILSDTSSPTVPFLLDQQIIFQVTNTLGSTCIVEATANFSPANWLPMQTNTAPFWFTNPITAPSMFYRVATP